MSNFTVFIRIVLAVIFGGLIGLEREHKGRAAGLRTHVLVCMGSCLIMLVSLSVFEAYKSQTPLDPGRIAAGVVTGIGFLGAGTIIRSVQHVSGLTTAASIWVSAGIGIGVGCGLYFASFLVTVFALVTLVLFKRIEGALEINDSAQNNQANPDGG
ncbi:MAG: MgtC/SapB family protein [Candidatus Omnitrophica bacterium]|nr:MgtC/SapB family protein [Candidatus Omnitrophota bacterium]